MPSLVIPMEKATKIIRASICTFLQNYGYFTTTVAFLAFPFSAAILLSQLFLPSSSSSSLLPFICSRLKALFQAAGFPPTSELFTFLSLKISQTIYSSIFTLPFTLTFLLFAKASIIQALKQHHHKLLSSSPPSFSSILSLYNPLFLTHVCNSFVILSANATVFAVLFFAFNFLEGIGFSSSPNWLLFLSAIGAVLYSIVLANALIICNLALVISGMERTSGYLAILKACVVMRGRTSTALSLALPVNLLLAGIEALFQYRTRRIYHHGGNPNLSMGSEGVLIAYLYSIAVVLDTVVSCIFYKSCKTRSLIELEEARYSYQIQIIQGETDDYLSVKNSEELP